MPIGRRPAPRSSGSFGNAGHDCWSPASRVLVERSVYEEVARKKIFVARVPPPARGRIQWTPATEIVSLISAGPSREVDGLGAARPFGGRKRPSAPAAGPLTETSTTAASSTEAGRVVFPHVAPGPLPIAQEENLRPVFVSPSRRFEPRRSDSGRQSTIVRASPARSWTHPRGDLGRALRVVRASRDGRDLGNKRAGAFTIWNALRRRQA